MGLKLRSVTSQVKVRSSSSWGVSTTKLSGLRANTPDPLNLSIDSEPLLLPLLKWCERMIDKLQGKLTIENSLRRFNQIRTRNEKSPGIH